jgi:glycosyltransferase involved in cell wall biosynthesis
MSAGEPPTLYLSIILPGYNERAGLEAAVATYQAALADAGITDYEIILVDDGSTDGTRELADALARGDPRVRVLHHAVNQGQVRAILNGFRAAHGRVLTHNGIDLPFDPGDTPSALVCFHEEADVVVVERVDRGSYGLIRKLLSWANVLLVKSLFRSPCRDHNFVQFFRREVLEAVPVRSSGVSTVTTELIVRAIRQGFRVVRIPGDYHCRQAGRSTITARKAFHALAQTLRLWWLLRRPEPTSTLRPPRQLSEAAS